MAITRLSGGTSPANGSDPRTFPTIFNAAADDIEAAESAISALEAPGAVVEASIADGAVTAPKLANTAGAVMVFDDSAARTAAIPTPSEGMVTYLKDTDSLDKFDGTNFVPVDTGGLVAVKSAINTGPEVFSSVAAGGNVAVPDLSITHEVADPANRLIISAFFGVVASSAGQSQVGIAVHDGTNLIGIGGAAGSRTQMTAGNRGSGSDAFNFTQPSITFVHTPGAGSKTYTVRAVNPESVRTIYVNRNVSDTDNNFNPRAVSSLVIQEVAV